MKSYGPILVFTALLLVSGWYLRDALGVSLSYSGAQEAVSTLVPVATMIPDPVWEIELVHQGENFYVKHIIKTHAPFSPLPATGAYTISVLDSEKHILFQQFYSGERTIRIPWLYDGAQLVVADDHEKTLLSFPLSRIPYDMI